MGPYPSGLKNVRMRRQGSAQSQAIDKPPTQAQIKKQITEQIISGKIPPGYSLPSIRGLARELGISVITVRKAYDDLENEGYIITRSGRGSFVAEAGAEMAREQKLIAAQNYIEKGLKECRELGLEKKEITKRSLYRFLSEEYNVKFNKLKTTLKAVASREKDRLYLEIEEENPVYLVKNITYDVNGRVVDYFESSFRGDNGLIQLKINNGN